MLLNTELMWWQSQMCLNIRSKGVFNGDTNDKQEIKNGKSPLIRFFWYVKKTI